MRKSEIRNPKSKIIRPILWVAGAITAAVILGALLMGVARGVVPTTSDAERFACNGTTTAFVFHFGVWNTSEAEVQKVTNATGAALLLTEASDYTVTLPNDDGWLTPGGTVTTATAYSSAYTLVIARLPILEQQSDYSTAESVDLESIEDDFDKSAVRDRYLQRLIRRSLRTASTDLTDVNLGTAAERASSTFTWDANGSPVMAAGLVSPNDVTVSPFWKTVLVEPNLAETLLQLNITRATTDAQKRAWIDVTEDPYLADGNGAADDTTAIQAAENAADDDGRTLYFPPGRYLISGTISFSAGVSVEAAPGATLAEDPCSPISGPMMQWTSASGFKVSGLNFAGAQVHAGYAGADNTISALYLNGCSKFTVEDVNVCAKSLGIYASSCTRGTIQNCRLIGFCVPANYGAGSAYNYNKAVWVRGSTDIVVTGNTMENWGDAVGSSQSSSRIQITNNNMAGGSDNLIYLSSGNDNLVQGNTLRNSIGGGIKARGSGHRILGNYVYECGSDAEDTLGVGIDVTCVQTTQYDGNNVVADNVVDKTTSYGILLRRLTTGNPGMRGWSVVNNKLYDCGDPNLADNFGMGICIGTGCGDGILSGNVVRNDHASATHGAIAVMGAATIDTNNVLVTNNLIDGPNDTGFYFQYTRNLVFSGNIVREAPSYAAYFSVDGSNVNVTGIGNLFDNPTAAGVTAVYGNADGAASPAVWAYNQARGNYTVCIHTRCVDANGISQWNRPDADSTERVLASTPVYLQNGDPKTTVYTVSAGRSAVVTKVILRNPSGSLAGGTDFNIGDGANADTWKANINLSTLTATTDCIVITNDNTKYTVFNAGDAIGIKPDTGSTADTYAQMILIGYEF